MLRWLLRRGHPRLPEADVEIFAETAHEPARAHAGQQLHWQLVLSDIPRLVLGSYRHQNLPVPTLLLPANVTLRFLRAASRGAESCADDRSRHRRHGPLPAEERPGIVAAAIREMARQ